MTVCSVLFVSGEEGPVLLVEQVILSESIYALKYLPGPAPEEESMVIIKLVPERIPFGFEGGASQYISI